MIFNFYWIIGQGKTRMEGTYWRAKWGYFFLFSIVFFSASLSSEQCTKYRTRANKCFFLRYLVHALRVGLVENNSL